MKTGFDKFLHCLDLYMELLNYPTIDGESRVKIYESVTLENGAITRATNNYHNKAWFSNVVVSMDFDELDDYISDQGVCYGLVPEFIVNTLIFFTSFNFYNKCLLFVDFIISRNINRK
jgi:hypothetical protein